MRRTFIAGVALAAWCALSNLSLADEAPSPDAVAAAGTPAGTSETVEPVEVQSTPAPKKTARGAYSQSFLDNDFSYLREDGTAEHYLGDELKQLQAGRARIDLGGEYRLRYHDEGNLRGKPISGRDDEFLLSRLRLFLNVQLNDNLRFFSEAIDADSYGENFPPRATEVNRFDAQTLGVDLRLLSDNSGGAWWVRGGRQEVNLGSTRLVFRRAWRNTPQNFDGLRTWLESDHHRFDAFWLRPIDVRQHAGGDSNFDHANSSHNFFGTFFTLGSDGDEKRELYYFGNVDSDSAVRNFDGSTGNFGVHTLGGRWLTPVGGEDSPWKLETEGGYQFGAYADDRHSAGFTVIGLGRKLSDGPMEPELWLYHDWASGDRDLDDGVHGTFQPPFPRGHYFLGFADVAGRQNVHDVNLQLSLKPTEQTRLRVAFHRFWLAAATDALYSTGGSPSYHGPTGQAGTDIGQEVDLVLNWDPSPRVGLLVGYSYFWKGDFFDSPVIQGPPAGLAGNGSDGQDASFVYVQSVLRF